LLAIISYAKDKRWNLISNKVNKRLPKMLEFIATKCGEAEKQTQQVKGTAG